MTGPTPSLRSPAAWSISGISGSLFRGDMLMEAWLDGVLYGPSILRSKDVSFVMGASKAELRLRS